MQKLNLSQKLIKDHLVKGEMKVGEEIYLKIDQTLTQDATGTMVMLELEAINLEKAKTEISVQYVDHNLLQTDFKNPDDHIFLESACNRFGIWYSPAGNGVSHPVHMERFGIPGKTLLGSDSHTPAAGSIGMLAIGAGGLEVALAICGRPYMVKMPKIMGIKLTGKMPDWVSSKDIILELLRRHDVNGGVGKILEYYGPGINTLSAMDRHVIANMGAELGATTSIFPSDEKTEDFLKSQQRSNDYFELKADKDCKYDEYDEIDLSKLEPLIACPSSPGNVLPVRKVAGRTIYQSMIGSSANPGIRDFAVPALILRGKKINPSVSLDINPTSRQILQNLVEMGFLNDFVKSGARIHQAGCNGCIGMGQAPATKKISLRTVPRNFPGRSGTKEDLVYLCSPETATASALNGLITDPRDLKMKYPQFVEPVEISINKEMIIEPDLTKKTLIKGPNIKSLPEFKPVENKIDSIVLLKVKDNISTDEILPAGTKVLPYRSNIPEISKFTFTQIDETFYERAFKIQKKGSIVIAGINFGQGSSREHAAIVLSFLGIKAVIAKSYARIFHKNLINFGVLPFVFLDENNYKTIDQDDEIFIENVKKTIQEDLKVKNITKGYDFYVKCPLSKTEEEILLCGGLINYYKKDLN
jgi:predicted aconitate hydratase